MSTLGRADFGFEGTDQEAAVSAFMEKHLEIFWERAVSEFETGFGIEVWPQWLV